MGPEVRITFVIYVQATPRLFSISPDHDLVIRLSISIGEDSLPAAGRFAPRAIKPCAQNDGFTWDKFLDKLVSFFA
jgi:hypothetical protein